KRGVQLSGARCKWTREQFRPLLAVWGSRRRSTWVQLASVAVLGGRRGSRLAMDVAKSQRAQLHSARCDAAIFWCRSEWLWLLPGCGTQADERRYSPCTRRLSLQSVTVVVRDRRSRVGHREGQSHICRLRQPNGFPCLATGSIPARLGGFLDHQSRLDCGR